MGKMNIHLHSQKDKFYLCNVCGKIFTACKGKIFYRLRSDPQLVMWVIVLLTYGCPLELCLVGTPVFQPDKTGFCHHTNYDALSLTITPFCRCSSVQSMSSK